MTYDTEQFYNFALAVFAGCAVAALAFRLMPPVPPALRARRLLAFALRDLRRLAVDPLQSKSEDWEGRMYGRLVALPDQAEPLERAQLLAALSVGSEIIHLRHMAPQLGVAADLDAVLQGVAQGNSAIVVARLRQLDRRLASGSDTGQEPASALRARGRILIMSEAFAEHASYLDAGAPA